MNYAATDAAAPASPGRVLVIGYGSPIRGDDAIGPLAADRLADKALPGAVSVESRHILTAELVPDLAAVDRVVFIDAAADGTPGEIRCRRIAPSRDAMSTMAHFLDPRELLAWTEALYGRAPEAWLVTVAGASFEYSSYALSPALEAAIDDLLVEIEALLE